MTDGVLRQGYRIFRAHAHASLTAHAPVVERLDLIIPPVQCVKRAIFDASLTESASVPVDVHSKFRNCAIHTHSPLQLLAFLQPGPILSLDVDTLLVLHSLHSRCTCNRHCFAHTNGLSFILSDKPIIVFSHAIPVSPEPVATTIPKGPLTIAGA